MSFRWNDGTGITFTKALEETTEDQRAFISRASSFGTNTGGA